jgi:hypothetical protein
VSTHSKRARPAQLNVQSTWIFLGNRRSVRISYATYPVQQAEDAEDGQPAQGRPTGREMRIFVKGEHPQDVVVLVHGFPDVSSLLLVRPWVVRVSELAFQRVWVVGRIDVASVLWVISLADRN